MKLTADIKLTRATYRHTTLLLTDGYVGYSC